MNIMERGSVQLKVATIMAELIEASNVKRDLLEADPLHPRWAH